VESSAGLVRASRKELGAFYTPRWLADALVSWALEGADGAVLDPSFGGCAFLEAALDTLQRRGVTDAHERVFGVDVDPAAWKYARSLFDAGVPRRNLRRGSFLDQRVLEALPTFAAVVGNPPYLRHHALDDATIDASQRHLSGLGYTLPRLASAWAYFTVLAVHKVSEGGRLALILPGSLLHAEYGKIVRRAVERAFGDVRLVHVHERLFEGTKEESIILLAGKRGTASAAGSTYTRVDNREGLLRALVTAYAGIPSDSFKISLLGSPHLEALERVRNAVAAPRLGDVATIRIGVVTGANRFFVRNREDALFKLKDVEGIDVICKNRWVRAPRITRTTISDMHRAGLVTRLAIIRGRGRATSNLRAELNDAEERGIADRYHCRLREPWFTIVDRDRPDMFLGYLNDEAPVLSQNAARAVCTNGIHRVTALDKRNIAAMVSGSHTSLFTLESEILGRNYGGGILKLEPSEAKRLSITLGIDNLEELVEAETMTERRRLADYALAARYNVAVADLELLSQAATLLRRARMVRARPISI
jgi:adenine-specific DNA-methyltransferase